MITYNNYSNDLKSEWDSFVACCDLEYLSLGKFTHYMY